jgi:hypothetical protein
MENKKIKGLMNYSEEDGIKEIPNIKDRLNGLKEDIAKLNNYRERWTDFDVAVLCWLLAHDPDELKFWKEVKF